MIGLLPILARWRLGLGIAGALAFIGLALAANHYRHAYHAEIARRKAQEAAYVAAQAEASLIAKRALDATEAQYRSKANEADQSYHAQLVDARAAAARYINASRVRGQAAARDAIAAIAASPDRGSGIPASLSANAVMVSEGDVQACTDAVTYAIGAHDWALTIPSIAPPRSP